ncbi:MAG: hypothetical protein P4L50_00800 [Anaerolineaceae bacterium]|nr:hypothetical protein [Anaerolineaceae bacterium]
MHRVNAYTVTCGVFQLYSIRIPSVFHPYSSCIPSVFQPYFSRIPSVFQPYSKLPEPYSSRIPLLTRSLYRARL